MLFKDRVRGMVNLHAEVIPQPKDSAINFISYHHGSFKAFCVKSHGRPSQKLIHQLENYQFKTGMTVYLVTEQSNHVPRFEHLNRYLKWRERIKAKYTKEKN